MSSGSTFLGFASRRGTIKPRVRERIVLVVELGPKVRKLKRLSGGVCKGYGVGVEVR